MKEQVNFAAACGTDCGECKFLNDKCSGCNNVEGKPFWSEAYNRDICGLFDCCVNKKKLEHCGLCEDLPCEMFLSQRDPSLSDKEFEDRLKKRQEDLNLRKEKGTETWLKERK